MPPSNPGSFYIGLMSGTSLDGVDAVLARADQVAPSGLRAIGTARLPFPIALRDAFLALQAPGPNEIEREALAANDLSRLYAACIADLLAASQVPAAAVQAIGAHGQTIRHRPELGFTRQSGNPALLAELTGIDVIADFRARDIAAGGQGAPLVPAFHRAAFGSGEDTRVVVNIGGIANVSILPANADAPAGGFDTGPGNVLMDAWTQVHLGQPYDAAGRWAASGKVLPQLLAAMLAEPFFALPPPKSTGRDLFHAAWLRSRLTAGPSPAPEDVQATLAALTAETIAAAIETHAPGASAAYVCGGGALNRHLMTTLAGALRERGHAARVLSTEALGVPPSDVEALAFAWLARRFVEGAPGNLPSVTGATGYRVLGALYPAG
ncbi:MAG: anhydro-N-acetylmuramic acid kinase [Burkholderiaceae bacterium]